MRDIFSLSTPFVFPKFEESLKNTLPELPRLEARVAQYMILNINALSFETGASLALKIGVSEVTVSRLLRRLGYHGMRGLKKTLREELYNWEPEQDDNENNQDIPDSIAHNMELEYKALREIYQQRTAPLWVQLVQSIVEADNVLVTGFQSVRGLAEDCARRLALVRGNVRFMAAHDSMLTEWLKWEDDDINPSRCLILIDVVPYAREALVLSKLCNDANDSLVVFTDEMCHWAKNHTEMVIYATTRTGLILESTVAIGAALNLMVNSVAHQYPQTYLTERLDQWQSYTQALKLF